MHPVEWMIGGSQEPVAPIPWGECRRVGGDLFFMKGGGCFRGGSTALMEEPFGKKTDWDPRQKVSSCLQTAKPDFKQAHRIKKMGGGRIGKIYGGENISDTELTAILWRSPKIKWTCTIGSGAWEKVAGPLSHRGNKHMSSRVLSVNKGEGHLCEGEE